MKLSYVSIAGGIIAFISIALPWWTMTQTSNLLGIAISSSLNLYLYRVSISLFDLEVGANLWFGWIALALIVAGGAFGIMGGIRRRSGVLLAGGALAMSSILIFVVGLLIELPEMSFMRESPKELFYFGTYGNSPFHFSIYLSSGFWLALIAGMIMLIVGVRARYESARRQPLSSTLPSPQNYCASCGTALADSERVRADGASFCMKCGKIVKKAQPLFYRRCATCGAELREGEFFCRKCGTAVSTSK